MMQPIAATTFPTTRRWTVLSLIEWSTNHLIEHGFDEARLHIELLLAHVLHYSRLQLYTNFDRPLTPNELAHFKELFKRRLTHEPLQYIIGETEFMGLPFYVNPNVLIPRPETEMLVEKSIEAIKSIENERVEVLDIGTGTGNVPIAIAKFASNANVTSIDVSEEALEVAAKNVERNGVSNVSLLNANVFDDFLSQTTFDVIVSNPPYISKDEFGSLQPEVQDFEPRVATTDGADGFTFIRRISKVAQQKLNAGGFLLMEIAYNQSESAKRIVKQGGLKDIEVFADFAGHPRIISARKR